MKIPVIINNRDLDPGRLIGQVERLCGGEIHLIDNASTYPPLVRFLDEFAADFHGTLHIHRFGNQGPRAACTVVNQLRASWTARGITHYATTDSDLDLEGVRADLLGQFAAILDADSQLVKVGSALRINDLPNTPLADYARTAEQKFWVDRYPTDIVPDLCYRGDLGETLAVYRLNPAWSGDYGPAVRVAGRYQVRHVPWYHTTENRPADHCWYIDHCRTDWTVYTARSDHQST
ncbi:MAG: hypothetical protein EHM42_11820 [Planctomycetaceae bacterium]|nr:MAG: hypothetical protein EHM42_11820 [Planctomycetaceae bacterium]